MTSSVADADLLRAYTPLLVLYPEIPENSVRERSPDYPHDSPLEYDYHPRDVKLVLENSTLHTRFRFGRGKTTGWRQMLDKMQRNGYQKNLDLVPGVKPKDTEGFWKKYASIPKDQEKFKRACYARIVRGRGFSHDRVVAQYWYAYFYNDFWNTHEMDWETVMVVFKVEGAQPKPTICALSAHNGGHWLPWRQVQKANDDSGETEDGTHPIVYVANGSHANYFYGPGVYVTAAPFEKMAADLLKKSRPLIDYTTSWQEGSRHLVEANLIPSSSDWTGEWRWLNQEGRWGSAGKWYDLEFGDSGPHGPPQAGDRWEFPFRWIDTHCKRALSEEESLVPTRIDP